MRVLLTCSQSEMFFFVKVARQYRWSKETHVEIIQYAFNFDEKKKEELRLDLHGDWYHVYNKQVSIKKQLFGNDEIVKLFDFLKKIKYII